MKQKWWDAEVAEAKRRLEIQAKEEAIMKALHEKRAERAAKERKYISTPSREAAMAGERGSGSSKSTASIKGGHQTQVMALSHMRTTDL